jgi:hypothetical protein
MKHWPWWLRFTAVALVVIGLGAGFLLIIHDWIWLYRNWWFIEWLEG